MRPLGGTFLGAVFLAGAATQPSVAHATGFFEAIGQALFGTRTAQPEVYDPRPGLSVTVRPRRRVTQRPHTSENAHKIANTAIDPVKHPNWYLQDPTMRKGDVVVLNGEVLVFNGGRAPYTRADFSALDESRLVSKPLRERIRAMAGLMPDTPSAPVKRAEASARAQTATSE